MSNNLSKRRKSHRDNSVQTHFLRLIEGETKIHYIYIIKQKTTNKKYFGVTQEPKKRIRSHLNSLRNGEHNNQFLQSDYLKYGESDFEIKIVESYEKREEAEKREMTLARRDDAYNIVLDTSRGGDTFTNNPRKEEIREGKRRQMSGKNNHQYGKKKTKRMIEAVKMANSKPIVADGVMYASVREASKATGVKQTTVSYRAKATSERFKDWYFV